MVATRTTTDRPRRVDDPARPAVLRDTGLIGDRRARASTGSPPLAACGIGAPIALVTLVEPDRQCSAGTEVVVRLPGAGWT